MEPKKRYKDFFLKSKEVSHLSDHRCKIGASVIHKNKIISSACNQRFIWDSLTRLYNPFSSIHAETSAILKVKNKKILKECVMFIYRERKDGSLGMCRPCKTCQRIMKSFGLLKVHYTSPEGYHYEEL